jgi:hypothetical protein
MKHNAYLNILINYMSYFKGIGRKSGSYTGRKLPLIGLLKNKKHTIFNEYIAGSGVGASSVATRRLKKQRSRIKKRTPPKPIYPELDDNNVYVVGDGEMDFDTILEEEINALPSGTTIDLGGNENEIVDVEVYTAFAQSQIEKVSTSTTITSLAFATFSEKNIVNSAVKTIDSAPNINELLSSDDYNVIAYKPIINSSSSVDDAKISQYTTHTFINTGTSTTGGIPNIEYIVTITEFIPL